MANTVRLFVPVSKVLSQSARAAAVVDRIRESRLVIGFLDNHKHNSSNVLNRLEIRLKERFANADFIRLMKPEAGKGAPKPMLEQLATQCHVVVNGIAD